MPLRPPAPIPRKSAPSQPKIEELALQILEFLAADPARLGRFFDLTGLDPQTLRQAADGPDFSASLLDYLCGDEPLLCAFAEQHGRNPAQIAAVRQRLEATGRKEC